MSQPYTHDSLPDMTFWANLDHRWTSRAMSSMQRCFCSKFCNFGIIFAAARFMPKTSVKIAWHEPNEMPTSSANSDVSDSTIIQNHLLHWFNVFTGYWGARANRTSIVIDILSAFLKPVIPQLNLCSALRRLAKRTFNFILYTNHNTLYFIHFYE